MNVHQIEQESLKLNSKSPQEIISWAFETFKSGLYQTTSFGLTGMVIMDMISKMNSGDYPVPVIFIDTLHHFKETIQLKEKAASTYKARVLTFKPQECNTVDEFKEKYDDQLWIKDPDKYDYIVKAEPGHRAYTELKVRAVFTGRRRSQGADRSKLQILEIDDSVTPFMVKINPLATWDFKQVQDYITLNNVIYNPLLDLGYKSIGDFHSTVPTQNGEGERDGRWKGQDKTECGLHKDYFKMKAKLKSEFHISGVCDINDAFNLLKTYSTEISAVSSIHYDQRYLSLRLKSLKQISIPSKQDFGIVPNDGPQILHVATAIASNPMTVESLAAIFQIVPDISKVLVLDGEVGIKVLHIVFKIDKAGLSNLNERLMAFGKESKIDIGVQEDNVYVRHKRLVIFDMDSTLIRQEVIDELAREAGVYSKIAAITEAAMRGEIDFNESLRQRVGLLAGSDASIIDKVKRRIEFTPGALELCQALKKLGFRLAVLSGGFMPLANYVKQTLGLDYAFANNLELSEEQKILTGKVRGEIVNGERKAELLSVISQAENIPKSQIIAVGDGANDLLMLSAAGLGIAFNAKPKVQQLAQIRLNQPSLINVLYFLGLSHKEIRDLIAL